MPNPQPAQPGAYALSAVLDLNAAKKLAADLLAHAGQDVDVDASGVTHLGGLCLQVLLAAQKQWAQDGHGFAVSAASDNFRAATALMGAGGLLATMEMEAQA